LASWGGGIVVVVAVAVCPTLEEEEEVRASPDALTSLELGSWLRERNSNASNVKSRWDIRRFSRSLRLRSSEQAEGALKFGNGIDFATSISITVLDSVDAVPEAA
jgi:hypothetical protein